jgi:hypothetical protein
MWKGKGTRGRRRVGDEKKGRPREPEGRDEKVTHVSRRKVVGK